MVLRRQRKWGEDLASAMSTVVAPGAHDLLAAEAAARSGSVHGWQRPSVSLEVTSSDLAVGFDAGGVVSEPSRKHLWY